MSKHRKLKRNAQRIHFRRRARERLGYDIPQEEVIRIKREIQNDTGDFITRPNERLSLWRVKIGNRGGFVVVYDAETEELVTMLTDGIWQEQDMRNSPHVEDSTALRSSLASQRGAESLLALRKKLGGT